MEAADRKPARPRDGPPFAAPRELGAPRGVAPGGLGVRVDSHLYNGYTIPPYYDSLLAKIIVHGRDRREALARMVRALEESVFEGVPTSIPFHLAVLGHPGFRRSGPRTKNMFVAPHLDCRPMTPPLSCVPGVLEDALSAAVQ